MSRPLRDRKAGNDKWPPPGTGRSCSTTIPAARPRRSTKLLAVPSEGFSAEEFGRTFQRFLESLPTLTASPTGVRARLREHFGTDPSGLPVASLEVPEYDRPNLQVALDAYLSREGRFAELLGFAAASQYVELSMSQLVARGRGPGSLALGPVGRTVVDLDEGRSLTCVTQGLFLVADGERRLAVLVARQSFRSPTPIVEVMAAELELCERFIAELRRLMVERNVYRRKLISLSLVGGPMGQQISVSFLARQRVGRDMIVLPGGLLERVERSTIEFDRHADALRARGRHVRRGLLLHGPPGTGKTLTATYLADALADRTVLVLTGPALALIRASCRMARELQPAMVVLEDIDLIAQERTQMGTGATSLLFELLNEIDGIGEDADVIFVMTTNRADLLEPALAARPGRVDQAVELPLPDGAARAALLELFCRGLSVELSERGGLVEETEGASPAFLRELVRKAVLYATAAGEETVRDEHFREGLRELDEGGRLTRSILGAGGDGAPASPASTGFPAPGGGG